MVGYLLRIQYSSVRCTGMRQSTCVVKSGQLSHVEPGPGVTAFSDRLASVFPIMTFSGISGFHVDHCPPRNRQPVLPRDEDMDGLLIKGPRLGDPVREQQRSRPLYMQKKKKLLKEPPPTKRNKTVLGLIDARTHQHINNRGQVCMCGGIERSTLLRTLLEARQGLTSLVLRHNT